MRIQAGFEFERIPFTLAQPGFGDGLHEDVVRFFRVQHCVHDAFNQRFGNRVTQAFVLGVHFGCVISI